VQDHWLSIVRFDTEANLQAWLASPERQKLLPEASDFTEEFRARIVRTGFDQWFPAKAGGTPPGAWKQNMLVLLLLYPVVFLFFTFVQTGLPFAVALFIANTVSVLLLNYLVPWTSRWFSWWLASDGPNTGWLQIAGATLVTALYGLMLLAFGWLMTSCCSLLPDNEAEARQANVLTKDEARRIAINVARLPELLGRPDPDQGT
jgi:hypothetical protein